MTMVRSWTRLGLAVALGVGAVGCGEPEAPRRRVSDRRDAAPAPTTTTATPDAEPKAVEAVAGWGTIKGKIVWAPEALPVVKKLDITKDKIVCDMGLPHVEETIVVDPETRGILNIVAYVDKPVAIHPDLPQDASATKADFLAKFKEMNGFEFKQMEQMVAEKTVELRAIKSPGHTIIDQVFCTYVPHAVAVREGQSTLALNPETIAHNIKVSSVGGRNSDNPNMPPGTMQFFDWYAERNPLRIECAIHGWMNMYAMVFDHPYFTVTGKDGSFEIANVPAGEVTLILRNPMYISVDKGLLGVKKKAERENKITIKPNETVDLGVIKVAPAGG